MTKSENFKNLLKNWKRISFRKLLYLPHLLNSWEKRLWLLLFLVTIFSGGAFFIRVYRGLTYPVPAVGDSYTEGILKAPRAVNPVFAYSDSDRDLTRLVFSGLFTYDGAGKIVPDLAENYSLSADGKIYTVNLKKNVLWHDGEKLSADDVVFTVKSIQNPVYKSPLRANWQGVEAKKLDDYRVEFDLKVPYTPFIENLTAGIIPKHLWENVAPADASLHELNLKPVGSGPYQFESLGQDKNGLVNAYYLKRNPHYYREGPYIKNLAFLFYDTEDELAAAWHKKDIDGFGPVPPQIAGEINPDKTSVILIKTPRIFGLFFNSENSKILADKKVRQAIADAIDKKKISELAVPAGLPLNSPLPWLEVNNDKYDPAQSQKLLAEAGWKNKNADGILERAVAKKGENSILSFELTTSNSPNLVEIAESLKEMLRPAGIDIVVKPYSFAELESSVIRPRNFQILLFGQVYGYEPDPLPFWHSSQIKDPGLNIALYSNKTADRILEEARRTSDFQKRDKEYAEFAALVEQDLPAVFLFSQLYSYALPADIKGASLTKISLPSDRFNEINKWYLDTKRVFK